MTELIAAGGPAFIVPTVLFILLLFGTRGLFSLHGRRSQQRKELLELWSDNRSKDDFWLELAVRHWLGTYLPAHVIRLAMKQPDKSQSLTDLSSLWPLLKYDSATRSVDWAWRGHRSSDYVKAERAGVIAFYFIFALSACGSARAAAQVGSATFSGWAYGVLTVVLGVFALACLWRDDTLKVAGRSGSNWIRRINSSNGLRLSKNPRA